MSVYDDIEGVIAAVDADIDRLNAAKLKLIQALDALDTGADADAEADPELQQLLDEEEDYVNLPTPAPKPRKNAKHDWDAIGEVARIAERAGSPIARTLADEFGVNMTTASWMVKRCRELGHIGPSERFTKEPMTREPFDHQAARERAAAAL